MSACEIRKKGKGHEKRTVIMIVMIAIRNASLVSTLSVFQCRTQNGYIMCP